MSTTKAPALLLGIGSGMAVTAAVIGLMRVLVAVAADMRADATALLTQHPLYRSAKDLILTSLLAAVPLGALWLLHRRR
ncbi:MAG: hypothetical protein LW854_10555 [Rubrivivax sp.]|jgi:hypothetical protein|nr:hypothetical protein [Rubrivivax sp.]